MMQMGRTALAVFAGLLWAGTIPATMPWTATIFALALAVWVIEGIRRMARSN